MDKDNVQTPCSTWNPRWLKQDYIYLAVAMLIKFGDAVEIYLPGVITLLVSCELNLSLFQEWVLTVIFYVFQGVGTLTAVPLAGKVGERTVLLVSLYGSILFTVLCSVVPNYYTLLLARALIGLGCGLNKVTVGVVGSRNVSSKEILPTFSFLHSGIAFTFGTGWASLLGWFLLDKVGWRKFVLFTSIPLFIPPIVIIHCCIEKESSAPESIALIKDQKEDKPVQNFPARVLKACLFGGFNIFIGYGSVMLLPTIIGKYNLEPLNLEGETVDCEDVVVHGNEYLLLAAVNGLANILGRPIGFFLRSQVKFILIQTAFMFGFAASYGFLLTRPGLLVESIMMGIGKLCYSMQGVEKSILHYDVDYFGPSGLALGGALMEVACLLGALISTSLPVLVDPYNAAAVA